MNDNRVYQREIKIHEIMFGIVSTIFSILWFFITIGVLVNVWQRKTIETLTKLLWTFAVIAMPVVGSVIYMLFGGHKEG